MGKFKNYFIVGAIAILLYRLIKSEIDEGIDSIELEEG